MDPEARTAEEKKGYLGILLGIVACLLLAGGAYFWATGIMDSLYAFRSPLHDRPPAPGQPLDEPLTRRVVFVLIDALREDTSLDPAVMPYLDELRRQGAWATMHSRPPSYSAPSYSVLFTGAWPDVSDGPALNLDYDEIPTWTQDDLASAVHRVGLQVAISAFNWFERLIPQASVSASFYTAGEDQAADREVVDAALPWLLDGDYQLVFVHLDQVDYAGHYEGGPQDPRWDAAARRADDLLREIGATLDLGQDTLFVASDHGQIDQGGHGGQDPIVLVEPFVLVGAGAKPGQYGDVNMIDVAPTLAALLGANIPASSQGRVLTQMLDLTADQQAAIDGATEAQQSQLLELYQAAIGRQAAVEPGADTVAAHQRALEAAQEARLRAERLPRAILALVVVLIPAVVIFLKRGRDLAWLLAGAVLYLILFNLRYWVLDGRTYSLSSVASADELLLYCAVTAVAALVVSWLVVVLALKLFRRRPREASQLVLGLTLTVAYLLLLPVLWSFVLNGTLVTWTLPEMASMFLGFIALIQILVVAVVGLALAGVGALIAALASPGRQTQT
ncbi:MAG: alkaline phosphatase family protein [Anaerolineae bacterium]